MKKGFLTLGMVIVLGGCSDPIRQTSGWTLLAAGLATSSVAGHKPFQPPLDEEERWHKEGATSTEITRALLECGVQQPRAPLPLSARNNLPSFTPNDGALAAHCMEASGFKSDYEGSWHGYCAGWHNVSQYPACASDAPAPQRNVRKRLNSEFCRVYPRADVCIP